MESPASGPLKELCFVMNGALQAPFFGRLSLPVYFFLLHPRVLQMKPTFSCCCPPLFCFPPSRRISWMSTSHFASSITEKSISVFFLRTARMEIILGREKVEAKKGVITGLMFIEQLCNRLFGNQIEHKYKFKLS